LYGESFRLQTIPSEIHRNDLLEQQSAVTLDVI
jgi:hypothetical protein